MKKLIVLGGFFLVVIASASLIMMEGCDGKLATLASIVPTAVPTATPLPTNQVSDFQSFGIGNNPVGTAINPTLMNFVAGSAGFTSFIPAAAPVNGVINPTAVVQSGFGNASDIYAARVNATWSDGAPASYNYPSAQMFAKLFSGTTWYQIPTGLTGIKFYLYIPIMTTTAAGPNYTFQFQIGLQQIIGTASGGLCNPGTPGNTCYDNWNYTVPVNAAVKSGYVLETVPFTALGFGYAFNTATTPNPCSLTTFIDGCNDKNVMELEWEGNSNAVAGNYAIDFRVDDVTFY